MVAEIDSPPSCLPLLPASERERGGPGRPIPRGRPSPSPALCGKEAADDLMGTTVVIHGAHHTATSLGVGKCVGPQRCSSTPRAGHPPIMAASPESRGEASGTRRPLLSRPESDLGRGLLASAQLRSKILLEPQPPRQEAKWGAGRWSPEWGRLPCVGTAAVGSCPLPALEGQARVIAPSWQSQKDA